MLSFLNWVVWWWRRDRVLLLNLEHVKCMVTTEYVVALNVDHPMTLDFLDELQRRLRQQVLPFPL